MSRNCSSCNCSTINKLFLQLAGLTNGIRPSNTRYSAKAANRSLQIMMMRALRAGVIVPYAAMPLITSGLVQILKEIIIRIEHKDIVALAE